MNEDSEKLFTTEQFNALTPEQQRAILAVGEYLTSRAVQVSDEGLSESLNLMRECRGCAPYEEIGDDLRATIRRKFAGVYEVALEMAEAELRAAGFKEREDFSLCLVIEPSHEDTTHVTIVDYHKPVCYLHEWSKAWHFGFGTLAELADTVLSAKAAIVNKVVSAKPKELVVVIQDGTVREVSGLPPNTRIVVANYDIEDVEKQELAPSPIDGELCKLTKF